MTAHEHHLHHLPHLDRLHHHHQQGHRDRLNFLKSPVDGHAGTFKAGAHDGDHIAEPALDEQEIPLLKRYDEPTLLEVFYDLFFAANYNVFSENKQVTNHNNFKSYIGYFCLLWMSWFLTASYDVRFVTDSIFERTARAVSLGVLVGFAIVAPNFDPGRQKASVMQTMSLILMFSRAILVIEYATILWHVRRFKKARIPLYASIAVNIMAMLIYLGITFRFREDKNSRVYITWYVVSSVECIVTLFIAYKWTVMDFSKTHFIKRLSLLTVMMLGDGLVNIAKDVVTIVETADSWDPRTIGLITAGVATIYFVFLIYFDWLRSSFYLPRLRNIVWTALHLPFHLSLVLFLQAFTQYIMWGKVMGILNHMNADLFSLDVDSAGAKVTNLTSAFMATDIQRSVDQFFALYPAKSSEVTSTVNVAIGNISRIPDGLWPQITLWEKTGNVSAISSDNFDAFSTVLYSLQNIVLSLTNNLFVVFGIDLAKDVIESGKVPTQGDVNSGVFQSTVDHKTWRRYRLVFAYGYIAAGSCLLLMAVLSIVARRTPWKPWPIIRLVILVLLAIGTGLVSLLWFDGPPSDGPQDAPPRTDRCLEYLATPWVLLTIFIVYTVVLILTHIGDAIARPNSKTSQQGPPIEKLSHDAASVPLTTSIDWRKEQPTEIRQEPATSH
ncbi:hypothetical protein E4U42_007965 [Claviceps africana]|uniref:Low temperature requirement A n=1 Tax=Claviceps africana TaxID=83212 RepID=A0A8K0NFU0_9HYPO|nr:hypothetical protein E4U42_007965 [Claviceps africana]